MTNRVSLPRVTVVTLALFFGFSAYWTATNVGYVPGYGDTGEYIKLAGTLRVDSYRRILYPLLLAIAGRCFGGLGFQPTSKAFPAMQIFQYAVSVGAVVYFLRVALPPCLAGARIRRSLWFPIAGLLAGLLVLDPVLSAFDLAIMTDGLTLSFSLVFCAAMADLATRRSPAALAWGALVVSSAALVGLRSEKGWVMLGTCACSWLAWKVLSRRGVVADAKEPLRRTTAAFVVIAAVSVAASIGHVFLYADQGRWPPSQTFVHHRLILYNLEAVRDRLPPDVQRRISVEDAHEYDLRNQNTWPVIDRITDGNADDRARLTREILAVVLRERWPLLLGRIAWDFVEDVFATPSFYVRVALWKLGGDGERAYNYHFEGMPWVYRNMSLVNARRSAVLVSAAAMLLVIACYFAAREVVRMASTGDASRPTADWWLTVVPFIAFWILNAGIFAATASVVFLRFTLFSHAMILFFVYVGALRWIFAERGPL